MNIKEIYKFLSPKFQNLFLDYKVNLKPRYGNGLPPHSELYSIIDANRDSYKVLINSVLSYKNNLWQIKKLRDEVDPSKPVWNNGFLPGLDIIAIYTLISELKPKNYIEIGSGNSTKVAFKAKTEHSSNTKITSIDPMPRVKIDNLTNKLIRQAFENMDFDIIDELNENDILFVDNSHRILPNSDAMVFLLKFCQN